LSRRSYFAAQGLSTTFLLIPNFYCYPRRQSAAPLRRYNLLTNFVIGIYIYVAIESFFDIREEGQKRNRIMEKKTTLSKTMQEYEDLQRKIELLKAQQKTVVHECKSQFSEDELTAQVEECKTIIAEFDAKIADAEAAVARLKADRKQKQAWIKGRLNVLNLKAGHMSRVSASHVYEHKTGKLTFQRGDVRIEIDANVPEWHNGALKQALNEHGLTDGTQRGIIHRMKKFVDEQKALASA